MHPHLLLPLFAGCLASFTLQAAETAYDFNLPAGTVGATLIGIGQVSGQQVLFIPADVAGRQAPAVRGHLSASEAVRQSLAGTGLSVLVTASGALSVQRTGDGLTLDATTINAIRQDGETADAGYVAQRSSVGTKTRTELVKIPQSVSVVTREELNTRKSDNLSDALKYTPGFSSQPASFSRTADDYTLRGFNVGAGTGGILRDGMKLQSNR